MQHIGINSHQLIVGNVLGFGGFGIVYEGEYFNEKVAIKVLKRREDEQARQEFQHELEVLRSLSHGNIVHLRGSLFTNSDCKIVMEFMPGGSLSKLLRSTTAISWLARYRIARDIGFGLEYLHSREIVHCDLKSDNILLDKDLKAKIADFGLAHFKSDNSTFGYCNAGTLVYMAPELLEGTEGAKNTKECDVYSYGVVLWELGTRQSPLALCGGVLSIAKKVVKGPEIREPIAPSTPGPIKELIEHCWRKNPSTRPSMVKIVEQLKKNPVQEEVQAEENRKKKEFSKIDFTAQPMIKIPTLKSVEWMESTKPVNKNPVQEGVQVKESANKKESNDREIVLAAIQKDF